MSNDNNFKDLNIEVSPDLEVDISIKIDSNCNIIVKMNDKDQFIISEIGTKNFNKQEIIDWDKTKKKLDSNLKDSGLSSNICRRISFLISQNYEMINGFVKSIIGSGNDEQNNKNGQKNKKEIKIFKYYSEKEQRLYESILLEGQPRFISYENGELIVTEKIVENTRILIPIGFEEGIAKPYEFENEEEISKYIDKTKKTSFSDYYKQIKSIVQKYIDQNSYIINMMTIDTILSYFQDRFPTTHYLFFIGDVGVGKSAFGLLFEWLAYRGVNMTDPSAPNIFRLLGKIQPAQCTLIMDEVEKIDTNQDIMNILKTGYSYNGKVPRVNSNTYEQEFFYTYSFKVFLSERLPNNSARGFMDRTFAITCIIGNPELSIKEVLQIHGKKGNQYQRELQEEILELRKSLFTFRLTHAYENRLEVDIGLTNRDKELCEGLSLFYGSEVQREVEETFQYFLNQKYESKGNSFDYLLLSQINKLLSKSKDKISISVKELWESIMDSTDCVSVKENALSLVDYGFVLYYNQLSSLCKKFGAGIKHTKDGNLLQFSASAKVRQAYQRYSQKPIINCSLVKHGEGGEGGEGSEGSTERTPQICEISLKDTNEPQSTNT
jgi:hypothetical protein